MLASRWSILALLFAVRTGMGLQYELVAALSPLFMADFAIGLADIGLLIGLYHAPGTVLAFPGGAIAAWLGDKQVVLAGLILMICGETATALASTWSGQIAARLVAGSGGILLSVVMTKMVADWFAGRELSTAMAIFGNSSIFGIALALVTLPFVAEASGRTAASFAVIAYLTVALLAMVSLYRLPCEDRLRTTAQSFWPDRRALMAVLAAGLVYGLYNVSLIVIFGFGPLMLTERGWSVTAAGSATSLVMWVVALSLPAGGMLADRTGRGPAILRGGLMAFAGALVLASRTDSVTPAFILLGIAAGLPCGPIMSLPTRVLRPETRSMGMGLFSPSTISYRWSDPGSPAQSPGWPAVRGSRSTSARLSCAWPSLPGWASGT